MPLTPSQIESHALWVAVDRVETAMAQAESLAGESSDSMLKMVPLVVADLRSIQDIPSWRFAGTAVLDNLNSQVSALASQIETAAAADDKASGAATLNANLISTLDQISAQLNSVPRPIAGARDGKGITTAAREISEMNRGELNALRAQVDELTTDIGAQGTRRDELDASLATLSTAIDAEKTRIGVTAAELESQFEEKSSEWEELAEAKRVEDSEAAKGVRDEDHEKAVALLGYLNEIHTQAQGLISATAERTTAQDFENYADDQQKQANNWSVGAVLLGATAVGLILVLVTMSHESSSLLTALKALGSLGLLGIMTFAARQVSYHKAEAKDARQISLSVKALGPFISELPEEQQQKIRADVARHMFERPFSRSGGSRLPSLKDATGKSASDSE